MSPRAWARLLVAGLHLALLAGLWMHRPGRLPADPGTRLTTVRLIQPRPPAPTPPDRARLPVTSLPTVPVATLPAPTPDTPPADAPATPPTAAAPAPVAPAEPPRSTLRLTLPPGHAASSAAARNPALTDLRANTPRLTLEDRIADATGGAGAWVEERTSDNRNQAVGALGEHRTVMRRGNTCVEIFRSRIADTDAFNGNVAPRATSMMGKPYKCR